MQLTPEQKESLKSLTEHRGFKILEEIVEDKRQSLYKSFEIVALGDAKTLEQLTGTQNYLKGMNYLVDTAKAKAKGVISAPDMS